MTKDHVERSAALHSQAHQAKGQNPSPDVLHVSQKSALIQTLTLSAPGQGAFSIVQTLIP